MLTARQRYLARQGVTGPWRIEGAEGKDCTSVVVIPACDEEDWLFCTLDSLAENRPESLHQTLILVVLNHTLQASDEVRAANLRTLVRLQTGPLNSRLRLAWIDAVSIGLELPVGGAGAARRLGFDHALAHLSHDGDSVLISLDADTLVEPNYLECLQQHFACCEAGGAVVPFAHQTAATPQLQAAIDHYEQFLRSYVFGMQLAGSPYAFHTIGSALACRASAYVRSGGMPQRPAGEDFYFLQNLAKTVGVEKVSGTCVYPAARVSGRVPFGTGPTLNRLSCDTEKQLFFPLDAFLLLGEFLRLSVGWTANGEELQERVDLMQSVLGQFLREQKLAVVVDRLRRNSTTQGQFVRAFHGWFDGLKSLRLLRRICAGSPFDMMPAEEAVPEFIYQAGQAGETELVRLLELVRFDQNNR